MLEQSKSFPISNPTPPFNYADLQLCVDQVVGQIGLPKTINLLESFIGGRRKAGLGNYRAKLILTFLISKSVQVFDLNEKRFFKSRAHKYCDARMACFHLMKRHTAYSLSEIGQLVQVTKKTPSYYNKKCESALSNANKQVFKEKYETLENYAIDFISHL